MYAGQQITENHADLKLLSPYPLPASLGSTVLVVGVWLAAGVEGDKPEVLLLREGRGAAAKIWPDVHDHPRRRFQQPSGRHPGRGGQAGMEAWLLKTVFFYLFFLLFFFSRFQRAWWLHPAYMYSCYDNASLTRQGRLAEWPRSRRNFAQKLV